MSRLPFVPSLRRRNAILLVALVAFWLAQAMAVAHSSRHVAGGDAGGLPGVHSQLCTDCASMLPLLAVAGGLGAAIALVRQVAQARLTTVTIRPVSTAPRRAFQSRAPPR